MADNGKIEKLKPFDFSKYENIDLDLLVMYAMAQLEKIGADLSFENAVVATFKFFPKKFSLLGFPSYPDSLRIYSSLWRCSTDKKKQWLGGKIRQGFIITERSRTFIKKAEDLLTGKSEKVKKATSKTRRKESILAEVESSSAYLKYKDGKKDYITESDFCYLLQGTLDSPRDILRKNLVVLKMFANELHHDDILNFIKWLENRFPKFFS